MWIRSQNREIITNSKNVIILEPKDEDKWLIGERVHPDEFLVLGKYLTKEKCIEVLDMIQETIEYGNKTIKKEKHELHTNQVFEMPREDEV